MATDIDNDEPIPLLKAISDLSQTGTIHYNFVLITDENDINPPTNVINVTETHYVVHILNEEINNPDNDNVNDYSCHR